MIETLKGGLGDPLLLMDQLLGSLSAYFLFTLDYTLSTALTIVVRGGYFGAAYSDTSLTLPASSTVYVEATGGTISMNTTGYTTGRTPIGIATTSTVGRTAWRQDFTVGGASGTPAPAPSPSPSPSPAPGPSPGPAPAPAPANPPFANVTLGLHFDGTSGSTTFTDNKGGAAPTSVTGTAAISTLQAKFGGSSAKFNQDGGIIYKTGGADVRFQFPGDFMIRVFAYANSGGSGSRVMFDTRASGFTPGVLVFLDGSGLLQFYLGGSNIFADTVTFPTNAFVEVEISRISGVFYLFKGGVLLSNYSSTLSLSDGRLTIGEVNPEYQTSTAWSGYLDEFEIAVGAGLHSASYTPRTSAFPDS